MKLAIFDKDGTLTTTASGEQFVQHPQDQVLLPGVAEAIAALSADDWAIAIASNQGGIAAGHKRLEETIEEMRFAMQLISSADPMAVFCPDFEGNHCHCIYDLQTLHVSHYGISDEVGAVHYSGLIGSYRKPNAGMLKLIIEKHRPVENVLFVGDRPEDEQAAASANVPFMWADQWRAQYAQY
jgi:D-glycero-D-manno-heptose 1,7-bisphosphate phosphatase